MKISLDDIKRLQSDQTDVSTDLPMKETKVKGRFSEFISKAVMVEDDDSEDTSDETVDPDVTNLAWVKWTLMGLAYLGAIALTTLVIMGFLNTPNVGLIESIIPQAVTNDDHHIILSGSYDDFYTLVDTYGDGQALESDDIVVDAPEVSDGAYEKRIENLQKEIRQLKDQLAQALEGESDPNTIPDRSEPDIEYVPSIDLTNAEIERLTAALTASEAREKASREALREAQGTP